MKRGFRRAPPEAPSQPGWQGGHMPPRLFFILIIGRYSVRMPILYARETDLSNWQSCRFYRGFLCKITIAQEQNLETTYRDSRCANQYFEKKIRHTSKIVNFPDRIYKHRSPNFCVNRWNLFFCSLVFFGFDFFRNHGLTVHIFLLSQ